MRPLVPTSTKLLSSGVVLAAMLSPAGCGSNGDSGNSSQDYFVNKVYPAIQPTCAECHATGEHGAPIFLADNPQGSYTAVKATVGLVAPPNVSPLVQHGLHLGPALTDVQANFVTQWLTMEAGPASDNAAPTNLRDAFKRFGECMDYTEWVAGGLDNIAKTASSGGAACTSCHNQGTASVYLNDQDPGGTFTHFAQFPYVERLVTGTVNDQGQFATLVDARRLIDKGTDPRQVNANNHPSFNLGDNSGVDPLTLQTNLTDFVSNTLNKMNRINGCDSVVKPDAGAGDGG